jgi:peptide/nickel transport system ATP-binding protein
VPDLAAPETILQIRELSIAYPIAIGTVRAVDKASLELSDGEALGLVGESGCGKSTLGLSILRLVRPPGRITSGSILYHGRDILAMKETEVRQLRGRAITMAFQNPLTSLNPLYRIDRQFLETIHEHEPRESKAGALARAERVLSALGVEPRRLYEYPHQLSGGMRQRVVIAMALACDPRLLIADEPTTALDVTIQAQILELLARLKEQRQMATLLITHDLGVVAETCDKVAIMNAGLIMEYADVQSIFTRARHPYTLGLLACIPRLGEKRDRLKVIDGGAGRTGPGKGESFLDRCAEPFGPYKGKLPPLREIAPGHFVRCWSL